MQICLQVFHETANRIPSLFWSQQQISASENTVHSVLAIVCVTRDLCRPIKGLAAKHVPFVFSPNRPLLLVAPRVMADSEAFQTR
jgi:hypothetical protein